MKERIVITGFEMITPLGEDSVKTWNALKENKSGIIKTNHLPCELVAYAKIEDVDERVYKMGLKATVGAINKAGIVSEELKNSRIGITLSLSKQNIPYLLDNNDLPKFLPISLGNYIKEKLNLRGLTKNVISACSTGNTSIVAGIQLLFEDEYDYVICGAAESSINPLICSGFMNMGVLAKNSGYPEKSVRPYDKNRTGFVIGEGCGVLILETLKHALKRNAKIYAEIAGYSIKNDAYSISSLEPSATVISKSIQECIEMAKIRPENIDYINSHGTATLQNDIIETKAIKLALGKYAYSVNISSTKAATGHLLGASSAVEAIFCILAMQENLIPPTLNLEEPDPQCDLNYTPLNWVNREVNYALSLAYGFGGHVSAILFKKWT